MVKNVNIITKLGGSYEKAVVADATCLIAKRTGLRDFQLARQFNIEAVSIDWLNDCYTKNTVAKLKQYALRPFHGLTVSCTQLSPDERLALQKLVEANGGIYSSSMVKDSTTHLVAQEPNGDKYSYAKLWKNVHIINMLWIQQCVKQQGFYLLLI